MKSERGDASCGDCLKQEKYWSVFVVYNFAEVFQIKYLSVQIIIRFDSWKSYVACEWHSEGKSVIAHEKLILQ